jgi:tripeptidyl-peptidase I
VTAVGATQVNPGATVRDPESAAAQIIFSGGGFSDIYRQFSFPLRISKSLCRKLTYHLALPDYQYFAVKEYFKFNNPPYTAQQYNNSMRTRGYPDLAANGVNYVIAIDGEFGLVFGTSASTPVVASMVHLQAPII